MELTREELPALAVKGRIAVPGTGYVRVAEFGLGTTDQIKAEVATLQKAGATRLILDLRGNAFGDVEAGLNAARMFVGSGTLAYPAGSRQGEGSHRRGVG